MRNKLFEKALSNSHINRVPTIVRSSIWDLFKPYGWWYSTNQWPETINWYITETYDGVEKEAPKVYWI